MKVRIGYMLQHEIEIKPSVYNGQINIHLEEHPVTIEDRIASALPGYWRWKAEGQPKYFQSYVPKGERAQMYYDNYRTNITEVPGHENEYKFRFQIDDGPEGDTWLEGRFTIAPQGLVTLLESRSAFG